MMNGIVQEPAVSKWWSIKRPAVIYNPIPLLCNDQSSAQEQEETWLRQNLHFQSELKWQLSLEHHRFWSQVVYNHSTMDALVSFLQEALPYYALPEYLSTPRIEESYHETARLVFMIFVRLGSSNEHPNYLPEDKQGVLIRDHHIFSLPILIDLCHLYARENRRAISKIVENVFRIQPNFSQDLIQLVTFLEDCLKMLTHSFCGAAAIRDTCGEPMPLALGGEQIALGDMRHDQCKDKLLYLLDSIASTNIFLDIHSVACRSFRKRHFHTRVAIFYHEVIPRIEKKIESFAANDDLITLYVDLKQKLNICKIELLRMFRYLTTSVIYKALDNRDRMSDEEIKEEVDDYLDSVTECLTEHAFMQDYHNVYGIDVDLDSISQISPHVDPVKFEYLMEAVLSSFSIPRERQVPNLAPNPKTKPQQKKTSSVVNYDYQEAGPSSSKANHPTGVELDSIVSQVKDLLPDLGDGFIEKCLEYYNYKSDQVINAVLESSLPDHLKELDPTLPIIPPEPAENDLPRRLNVFDNDEFDIMTRDNIDMSRVHIGKRRTVPKNVFDFLNDKSDIAEMRDRYALYGSIDTTGSMYDDEYDDTYEDQDICVEAGDNEQRQFVVPRVLQSSQKESVEEEGSESNEEEEAPERPRDQFCQNPAELRARAEQRRQDKMRPRGGGGGRGAGGGGGGGRGGKAGPTSNKDVVGKPKGQGQEKQVQMNRENKSVNKSSRGNHNRRKGAQFKRNQGMIPS